MHCPFKKNKEKRREKQQSVACHSNQLPSPAPPSHDNKFLLQAALLSLTDKITRSMHYEAESRFGEENDSFGSSWTTHTECTVITLPLHATEACFHGLLLAQGTRRSAYRNDQTDHSYQ